MRPFHAGFLLLALVTLGCHSASPDDTAMTLRTYEAPKGTARSLLSTLKDALWMEDKSVGRATMTPDGRIAVLAPGNVQVGVAKLIEGVTARPPAIEQSIELHYFIMLGKPVAAPAPPPRGVAEIQPALDEIVRSQGPQEFTLAKRVTLSSHNDEEGRLDGEELEVRQKCVETSDGVYAIVGVRYGKSDKVDTRVRLVQDRIVVLGATGQHAGDADGSTLYYVIRVAPRADGHHP